MAMRDSLCIKGVTASSSGSLKAAARMIDTLTATSSSVVTVRSWALGGSSRLAIVIGATIVYVDQPEAAARSAPVMTVWTRKLRFWAPNWLCGGLTSIEQLKLVSQSMLR